MNGKISSLRGAVLVFAAAMSVGCASTPLIEAIKKKDHAMVEQLLAADGNLNLEKQDSDYNTALELAVINKDRALVEKLLDKGANPQPGLLNAVRQADGALIKLLLNKGAKIDNAVGREAVLTRDFDVVRTYLDAGGDAIFVADLSYMLGTAAEEEHSPISALLIGRGADVDEAFQVLTERVKWAAGAKESSRRYKRLVAEYTQTEALARAGIEFLQRLMRDENALYALANPQAPVDPDEEKAFAAEAARYRALAVKPTLPKKARRFKVQAEAAVRDKRFDRAVERYASALEIAPWWPEGHFNRALILGELRSYKAAIREMKRYLALVPGAADAQKAEDKIYEWEDK